MSQLAPRHGTTLGYFADRCRCDFCQSAQRAYNQGRRSTAKARKVNTQGLLDSMRTMVTEWCRLQDELMEPPPLNRLTQHQQECVRASLLYVLSTQATRPLDLDEIVWELVEEGLWLPSIRDGMQGYLGELQRMYYGHHNGFPERITADSYRKHTTKTKWSYIGRTG